VILVRELLRWCLLKKKMIVDSVWRIANTNDLRQPSLRSWVLSLCHNLPFSDAGPKERCHSRLHVRPSAVEKKVAVLTTHHAKVLGSDALRVEEIDEPPVAFGGHRIVRLPTVGGNHESIRP